jgi:putative colanic acid biosynthesis acetyltransferase WcaF
MAVIAKPAPAGLDIAANRAARKWSRKELAGRLLWDLAAPVFALSPRPLWGLRRALLRAFGARIGRNVHILPSVRITIPWNLDIGDEAAVGEGAILYALGPIRIGRQATISQYAHLCAGTHDFNRSAWGPGSAPTPLWGRASSSARGPWSAPGQWR